MKTYKELKQEEKLINEKLNKLKEEINNEVKKLNQLKTKYPEEFRILPKNFTDLDKLVARIEFIKEDIEESETIKEEEKKSLIEQLNEFIKNIKEINNVNNKNEELLTDIWEEQVERRKFVLSQIDSIRDTKKQIEPLEKKEAYYKSIIDDASENDLDVSLLQEIKELIKKLSEEKKLILSSLDEKTIKELEEDAKLIEEEDKLKAINSPQTQNKDSEMDAEVVAAVEEVFKKQTTTNSEEENAEQVVQKLKNPKSQSSETISSVILGEEEEQEVVDTHPASNELIAKIKKYGKIGVGVTVIVSTVVAVATNPIVLAAFPAGIVGAKVYEHIKAKKKTKE